MTLPLPDQAPADLTPTASFTQTAVATPPSLAGYSQQAQQATAETGKLNAALDGLSQRFDGITKRTGQRLLSFSARDFAVLSGAAADSATFEKQLGTLNATAQVTPLNMRQIKKSVEETFTSMPVARGDVVALATALTNLGVTGAKDVGSLIKTFEKLGAATGEGPQTLASGMVQLSRMFGTTDATKIAGYANSLLTVSKNAGVSASGVLSFSNAIAPLARQAGISQASVLGISTAFSKAGADGFLAANTFNSIVGDITGLIQSGSPQLSKYANLIGVTSDQFKKMDKTTALERIFTTIAGQGPKAINTLNRLGIDGVRAQSAITAVVQSGDLEKNIRLAQGSSGNTKNLDKASDAAEGGLINNLTKFRNQLTNIGDFFGEHLIGPMTGAVKLFTQMTSAVGAVLRPLAPLLDILGAIAGAFSAIGGGALLATGLLAKFALVGFAGRSSPIQALRAGIANASGREPRTARGRQIAGIYGQRAAVPAGERGGLRWWQRPFYAAGSRIGERQAARDAAAMRPSPTATREERAARVPMVSRMATAPIRATTALVRGQNEYLRNAGRPGYARTGGILGGIGNAATRVGRWFSPEPRRPMPGPGGRAPADLGPRRPLPTPGGYTAAERGAARFATATNAAAAATSSATKVQVRGSEQQVAAQRSVIAASRQLAGAMLRTVASTAGAGLRTAGAAAGGLAARAASSTYGALGGAVGIGLLGLAFAPQIAGLFKGPPDRSREVDSSLNPIQAYNKQLGNVASNLAVFGQAVESASDKLGRLPGGSTLNSVSQVGDSDIAKAAGGYKQTDNSLAALAKRAPSNTAAAVSYLNQLSTTQGGFDTKTLQAAKLNLIKAYGPEQAQAILNAYMAQPNANTARSFNPADPSTIASVGAGADNDTYKAAVGAAVTAAKGRADQAGGTQSQKALLDQLSRIGMASGIRGGNLGKPTQNENSFGTYLDQVIGAKSGTTNTSAINLYGATPIAIISSLARSKEGKAFLDSAGIDSKKVEELNNDPNGNAGMQALLRSYGIDPRKASGTAYGSYSESPLAKKIGGIGGFGKFALDDSRVQAASSRPDDPAAQYQAMTALYGKAGGDTGASVDKIVTSFDKLEGAINDATDPLYKLSRASRDYAQRMEGYALPDMSRNQQLGTAARDLRRAQIAQRDNPTADTPGDLKAAQDAYVQQRQAATQYYNSIYQQLKGFNVQMERGEEDRNTQIFRMNRDFQIQQLQSEEDFGRQRFRQFRDRGIMMANQARTQAQTIYNPYQRVQSQYTASGDTLGYNLVDENQRLRRQKRSLDALKAMGLSTQAIQTLNLSTAEQAQQVDRLLMDAKADPSVIGNLNAQTATRIRLTRSLTQNNYSLSFQTSNQDFTRGLKDASRDYDIARRRAVDSQGRALNDMAADYEKMVRRSAQDLRTSMTELYGGFAKAQRRAANEINNGLEGTVPALAKTLRRQMETAQRIINGTTLTLSVKPAKTGDVGTANSREGSAGPAAKPSVSKPGVLGYATDGRFGAYNASGKFLEYPMIVGTPSQYPHILNPKTGHAMGALSMKEHVAHFSEGNRPEMVVPLDRAVGVNAMVSFVQQVSMATLRTLAGRQNGLPMIGGGGKGMGGDHYQVDKSTNFTGPITVEAQDPNEMARKLEDKKRVDRLSAPARSYGSS